MNGDEEWLQDVRRWYFGGHAPQSELSADGLDIDEESAVGFESTAQGQQGLCPRASWVANCSSRG